MRRLLMGAIGALVLTGTAHATTVTCWFPQDGTPKALEVVFPNATPPTVLSFGVIKFTSQGVHHVIINTPCDITS